VPPGEVEIIFTTVQVYDALIVSGTLVLARNIGDTSGRTIIIVFAPQRRRACGTAVRATAKMLY